MNILITGAAGFIGFHTTKALQKKGYNCIGIDNLNDYYDVSLKQARLNELDDLKFIHADISDKSVLFDTIEKHQIDKIVHLAAQAGVRYSLENPYAYGDSNLTGFLNILEAARQFDIRHLVYASSSSVYGDNKKVPFSESDRVDNPVSLYAATKRANELMAQSYSNLYSLPLTGLRFFTVYGPWGRPDMAYFSFVKDILDNRPLRVFNNGNLSRDFTYIDDIVNGIVSIVEQGPKDNMLYNIGYGSPVQLLEFIELIEEALGKQAVKEFVPMQPGDVPATWADTGLLENDYSYKPQVPFYDGIKEFVNWYRKYYE